MSEPTPKYLSTARACKFFGIARETLLKWGKAGLIGSYNTKGDGKGCVKWDVRSFKGNVQTVNSDNEEGTVEAEESTKTVSTRIGVCYCRVSTKDQINELNEQVELMKSQYPDFEIITDIGSGTTFKRKGIRNLLDRIGDGDISTVVVSHKDRLARFGLEVFKWIFNKFDVELVILNPGFGSKEAEMCDDLFSIVRVFSYKAIDGRPYKRKNKEADQNEEEKDDKDETEESVEDE